MFWSGAVIGMIVTITATPRVIIRKAFHRAIIVCSVGVVLPKMLRIVVWLFVASSTPTAEASTVACALPSKFTLSSPQKNCKLKPTK